MPGRPRWRFWVRGTLIAAIVGHWLGNVVCDRAEYLEAGFTYTWRASLPIVIQTVLVAMVVAGLGLLPERGPGRRSRRLPGAALLAALLFAQMALFVLLEGTERLLQGPFVEGNSRLFESGFILELAFALGAALVLMALGSLALRVIRSIRRRPPTAVLEPPRISEPVLRFVPVRVAAGPLGRRAPPLPV